MILPVFSGVKKHSFCTDRPQHCHLLTLYIVCNIYINTEALIRCQSYFCALWTLQKEKFYVLRRGSVVAAMSTDQGTLWMFIDDLFSTDRSDLHRKKARHEQYPIMFTRIQAIFIHLSKIKISHTHPSLLLQPVSFSELTQSHMRPWSLTCFLFCTSCSFCLLLISKTLLWKPIFYHHYWYLLSHFLWNIEKR